VAEQERSRGTMPYQKFPQDSTNQNRRCLWPVLNYFFFFFFLRVKRESSFFAAREERHLSPIYSRGAEGLAEFATFRSRSHLWAVSSGA
jgi:hypothetical protein